MENPEITDAQIDALQETEEQGAKRYNDEQRAIRLARGEKVISPVTTMGPSKFIVGKRVDVQVEEQMEDLSDYPYTCPPYSPVVHSPRDYGESNP
jgi:hypothetical protein